MRKLNFNNNYKISRNEWTFYQRITPNISNSSDITPIYFNNSSQRNKNKSLKKDILIKEENKTDYIKKEKNIMNISTDKIIVGDTINNNDIKYIFENSANSYMNNFQTNKAFSESNKILENYIIRLKNFGFPELGEIYLSSDISEQEKTFIFFDYLISKETKNLETYSFKEREKEEKIKIIKKLENKISKLTEELNIKEKELVNIDNKLKGQKDFYENEITQLTKDKENLIYINNKISLKKKNLEHKFYSLNQTLNKFQNIKSNIINAVEVIDQTQNKDMTKMLNRVKNTEKLISSLKTEYNESLRQLSFQISSFRHLIIEINKEICILLNNSYNIGNEIFELPFLEEINYIKKVFKKNLDSLKEMIYLNNTEDLV